MTSGCDDQFTFQRRKLAILKWAKRCCGSVSPEVVNDQSRGKEIFEMRGKAKRIENNLPRSFAHKQRTCFFSYHIRSKSGNKRSGMMGPKPQPALQRLFRQSFKSSHTPHCILLQQKPNRNPSACPWFPFLHLAPHPLSLRPLFCET